MSRVREIKKTIKAELALVDIHPSNKELDDLFDKVRTQADGLKKFTQVIEDVITDMAQNAEEDIERLEGQYKSDNAEPMRELRDALETLGADFGDTVNAMEEAVDNLNQLLETLTTVANLPKI